MLIYYIRIDYRPQNTFCQNEVSEDRCHEEIFTEAALQEFIGVLRCQYLYSCTSKASKLRTLTEEALEEIGRKNIPARDARSSV
jgi:hypothetical protein